MTQREQGDITQDTHTPSPQRIIISGESIKTQKQSGGGGVQPRTTGDIRHENRKKQKGSRKKTKIKNKNWQGTPGDVTGMALGASDEGRKFQDVSLEDSHSADRVQVSTLGPDLGDAGAQEGGPGPSCLKEGSLEVDWNFGRKGGGAQEDPEPGRRKDGCQEDSPEPGLAAEEMVLW